MISRDVVVGRATSILLYGIYEVLEILELIVFLFKLKLLILCISETSILLCIDVSPPKVTIPFFNCYSLSSSKTLSILLGMENLYENS
jgi:hypothetical protein